jgi:hypothetical protein
MAGTILARAFASVLTIGGRATKSLGQFLVRLIGKMQKAPFIHFKPVLPFRERLSKLVDDNNVVGLSGAPGPSPYKRSTETYRLLMAVLGLSAQVCS